MKSQAVRMALEAGVSLKSGIDGQLAGMVSVESLERLIVVVIAEQRVKYDAIVQAATSLMRVHLDNAAVHPCDHDNDRIRAAHCMPEVQETFKVISQLARGSARGATAAPGGVAGKKEG